MFNLEYAKALQVGTLFCLDIQTFAMSSDFKSDQTPVSLQQSSGDIIIPVIEEQVVINKKVVDTAKVNVRKTVHEDVESYAIPLIEEHVSIERIPKNIFVDSMPPAIRHEGDVTIIPVLKEVAVVEKRIMLVEEVHITKYTTQKTETHEVALKKEQVDVIRTDLNNR